MEYFTHSKYIRLRSHHNKFLIPKSDGESVKQSRNGRTRKARWTIELVDDKLNMIRLKSYNNKFLTISDESFLLGWTGKKALLETNRSPSNTNWEPIREEYFVKLRAPSSGKFLRANGGSPPWRNSVTVDLPEKKVTQNWILWTVDILDDDDVVVDDGDKCVWPKNKYNSMDSNLAGISGSSSSTDHDHEEGESSSCNELEVSESTDLVPFSSLRSYKSKTRMELFQNAKTIRLRSHHDKFLLADDDKETVCQDRHGGSRQARWTVEYITSEQETIGSGVVRLKSIYDTYLTATDDEFLLGVTGKKVKQTMPTRLNSSIEWEPIRDGMQIKLKTRYGNFLRANGGLPPWRNSITHDVPSRSHTQDWILWEIDVLEVYPVVEERKKKINRLESEVEPFSFNPSLHGRSQSSDSSGVKNEGKIVHYNIVDDDGNIVEGDNTIVFKGNGINELAQMLEEETTLPDITICSRNPLNGKLNPMRLALPPNHVKLHVYVVPSSSAAAAEFGTI